MTLLYRGVEPREPSMEQLLESLEACELHRVAGKKGSEGSARLCESCVEIGHLRQLCRIARDDEGTSRGHRAPVRPGYLL